MKKTTLLLYALILVIASNTVSYSQDDAFTQSMSPGDMHKTLAKHDGNWTAEMTMYMVPGTDPIKSTSTVVNKMILGGRYQESKHSGNIMGMAFEGISVTGYDNNRKVFVSTWIDNLGTSITYMEGTWDAATKSIILQGKSASMTGEQIVIREIITLVDDNTEKMVMYTINNGEETKTMEATLTRKK